MYQQSEKNLLNNNISSTCPHNMVNLGPLMAEIVWRIWGTPANFSGFCVLALLVHRHRSTEVSQTLHDVWASPSLVHYVYILAAVAPDRILPPSLGMVQGMELRNFRRECHLYSAGRPSSWASATFLLLIVRIWFLVMQNLHDVMSILYTFTAYCIIYTVSQ